MRILRFLPFFPRRAGKSSTGILPIDPREEELLARQKAAREIREEKRTCPNR